MVATASSSDEAALDLHPAPLVSHDQGRTIVWLDGEHDIATGTVVADSLARATSADGADLIVDLSGVTFFGAATLGVLIRGRNILRGESRNLTLRSPSRCARRVLDVCGLAGLVEPRQP